MHTRNFITHYLNLIQAMGGISFKKLEPLLITQKKCLRIMFGDNEAYHNKFKTAARVRPRELQKLGAEFYELEHSKQENKYFFKKTSILFFTHIIQNNKNISISLDLIFFNKRRMIHHYSIQFIRGICKEHHI